MNRIFCLVPVVMIAFGTSSAFAEEIPVAAGEAPVVTLSSTLPAGSDRACLKPPSLLGAAAIETFMKDPADLLKRYPDPEKTAATPAPEKTMAQEVRNLAGSDIDTIDPLLALVKTATAGQKAAIGSGLAQAALACAINRADINLALAIQKKVAQSGDTALVEAFLAGTNDVETAALGGGVAARAASLLASGAAAANLAANTVGNQGATSGTVSSRGASISSPLRTSSASPFSPASP